jgi:hypothetical protein
MTLIRMMVVVVEEIRLIYLQQQQEGPGNVRKYVMRLDMDESVVADILTELEVISIMKSRY